MLLCIPRRDQEAGSKVGESKDSRLWTWRKKKGQRHASSKPGPPSTGCLGCFYFLSASLCSHVFPAFPGSLPSGKGDPSGPFYFLSGLSGIVHRRLCTLAASTILAVASARILAALNSFREFSRSLSPSASALMALTRSEVAWARMRACRTISPERTGHSQVRKPETLQGC